MRLIDADALMKCILSEEYGSRFAVVSAPTIDLSDYSDRLWRNAYEQGRADAEAERRMGKWVYNSPVTVKCDQCGHVIADWNWNESNFCPHCGADMRGEVDEG